MTLRLTASEVDCLVKASERPEPIPLLLGSGAVPANPMVFPPDWGFGCKLTSRWLTDVTRSVDRKKSEKWVLASRPARSMEVTIVCMSKEESAAAQMACMGMMVSHGSPVPIYPDMAEISSLSGSSTTWEIFGDFRYRRFFPGGRVCFMPNFISPNKADNSVIFGTLLEIAPGYMKVELIAEAMRTLKTSDVVFPCMDVELLEESSGLSITDSIYQLSLNWNELEGSSSLPPSWPAITATSAELAAPLCTILDNLPVFPLNPDWTDGVEIAISREMGSSKSGRTSIQEPVGGTYHRFDLSVMGYNREACWRVGRFFDAVRGRGASFYFLHPQSPWTLTTFPTTSQVSIKAVGSLQGMGFYSKVVFTRADGSMVTRDISSVVQTGGGALYTILLTSALPDTNFVSVQPIFVCSFDQDDLEESWNTSAVVPAFRLSIVEEPGYGTASIPHLGYTEENPGFLSVSGCNLLFRAGAGCAPAGVWPGAATSYVSRIVDETRKVVRTPAGHQIFKALDVAGGNNTADLIRWATPWQNNGQPCIRDASYVLSHQLFTGLPALDRTLWSPTNGWTLFMCWTPVVKQVVAVDATVFRITSDAIDLHFKFDTAGATGAGRSRLVINGATIVPLSQELGNPFLPVFLTVHHSGTHFRVWVNGLQATAAAQAQALPVPSSYSASSWFPFLFSNRATTSAILANDWGVYGAANLLLSYDRGLDISEINAIHSRIADLYKTSVSPSAIYA